MVNSYVYYTGDGSTTNFQITFDYLSKEFVQVYLDGVLLEVETDYIFAGDRTILIPSIPPNGSIVFIRRVTSKDRLVEFRDASILVANDLDVSALQAIHIAEEANDNIQNVIQADPNGNFDVLNRRLVNVDSPVDGTDGANKAYVDTRFAADVATAVAARDDAQVFANIADVRATQASGSAVVAAQSALEAQTIVNNAALSNLPVGSLIWVTGVNAPAGFIVGDGELRSRAAFPDLWAFAQASGNISVDDVSWTFGQYSPGDGSTTFRVPKVDDRFIRGKSGTRAVGLVEEDAFQGHRMAAANGAEFLISEAGVSSFTAGELWDTYPTTGDPVTDGVNGTPRTADETRPKALTMLPCIKAYDVISDPNVLNAVEVVNEISRLESEKLRKDENINLGVSVAASGTAVDFVGIPEGVKRITVMFDGVSTNGANNIIVQLGDGVIQTTGYSSMRAGITNGPATFIEGVESGFLFGGGGTDLTCRGSIIISKMNNTTWVYSGSARNYGNTHVGEFCGGDVVFSGTLDRLRVTTANGTDQFDAGTINISWEF